jgi:hypothetical protein
MEPKDWLPIAISATALAVSLWTFQRAAVSAKKKSARDLWQRVIEIYIEHPTHYDGLPATTTEADRKRYEINASFVLFALEDILAAYPYDDAWKALVRRQLERHQAYVKVIRADQARFKIYSPPLQAMMKALP